MKPRAHPTIGPRWMEHVPALREIRGQLPEVPRSVYLPSPPPARRPSFNFGRIARRLWGS